MAQHHLSSTWKTITSSKHSASSSRYLKLICLSTINKKSHNKQPFFSFYNSSSLEHCKCSCYVSHKTKLSHIEKKKKTLVCVKKSYDQNEGSITVSNLESLSKVKKQSSWKKILFSSKKLRSIVLLNVITIVYASDIPVLKTVETIMDPAAFSAARFIMSAIPFLPFVFRARNDVKTRNAGIELGLWVSLAYCVEALGLVTSDAGRASFLSLFTVIVVPLLDGMLGAIIPSRTWFGVFMSAIGVAMLECSGTPPSFGDLLNFLSAIFFGIHMLRTEHISRSTKKENVLALLGYELSVVAVVSTIWVLIGGWFDGIDSFDQPSWTWSLLWEWLVAFPWIPALYTGVFSTGLCLWIEIAAMRDVSATETAVIYGLEPLWGAGFAWFLLGERWGTVGWIGAALVLGGSLVVQMVGSSPNKSLQAKESDLLIVSEKQKLQRSLKTSPVVIRSTKDVVDTFK